jgi:hypothetical protein
MHRLSLESTNSGHAALTGYCERDNEPSGSAIGWGILHSQARINHLKTQSHVIRYMR